jgi:hydrogenase expression/formation protein HypE
LAGVLADVAERTGLCVEIEERRLPQHRSTRAAADMLGFDLLSVANEGKVVLIVDEADAGRCVEIMRGHRHGRAAAQIGRIIRGRPPLVELITVVGGRRVVSRPFGEELPRIC